VNESELVAILGHELGHWKRAHTIQMFLVSQVRTPPHKMPKPFFFPKVNKGNSEQMQKENSEKLKSEPNAPNNRYECLMREGPSSFI
jgi:hypothetical protein